MLLQPIWLKNLSYLLSKTHGPIQSNGLKRVIMSTWLNKPCLLIPLDILKMRHFVMFYLWMLIMCHLVYHGSLIRGLFTMENQPPTPLKSRVEATPYLFCPLAKLDLALR